MKRKKHFLPKKCVKILIRKKSFSHRHRLGQDNEPVGIGTNHAGTRSTLPAKEGVATTEKDRREV